MRRLPAAAALILLVAGSALAAPLEDFHRELDAARTPLRIASFNLRTGNIDIVAFELDDGVRRWRALADRWAKAPPDAYATDAAFAETLGRAAVLVEEARTAAARRDAPAARKPLDLVNEALRDLRRRSGVTTLTDHVERYGAALDPVAQDLRRYEQPTQEILVALRRDVDKLRGLAQAIGTNAPPPLREDAHFLNLLKTNLDSIGRVGEAAQRAEGRAIVDSLRELRSAYNLLYLRFG